MRARSARTRSLLRETACTYSLAFDTQRYRCEAAMKNLFQAARVLLSDLASTLLFLVVYLVTDNLLLAAGAGMVLAVIQIGSELLRGKPIAALQWISAALVLASGTATFITNDPLFVMLKPSIIYAIIGL